MSSPADLQPLIDTPKEELAAEYKTWLDLSRNEGKATLTKAAIAIANHGGGYVILGFDEEGENLISAPRPDNFPDVTQDTVNAAIRRYATPEFHCEVHMILSRDTGVEHPVICIPRDQTEPVMSKRDCNGVIAQNRCYVRKPGPRSEEPQTSEEWRALIGRCVRANREDMLESIRSIVSGRVDAVVSPKNTHEALRQFCGNAFSRWQEFTDETPVDSPSRFPDGFYEMGFALLDAEPTQSLSVLQERLQHTRNVRMTGWGPFLAMNRSEWHPYAYEGMVEAWVGCPVGDRVSEIEPAHADFWRADREGNLYTIRGYTEDSLVNIPAGQVIDITLPVWRVGEAAYFATRYAAQFEAVEAIAIYVRFTGLNGRALTSINGRRLLFDDRLCRTDEVVLETTTSVAQLRDNMVEVIHELLRPLYEAFSFFELSAVLVEEELARMRR